MSGAGVLLVNLGSPDSPLVPDVRRYLREFLMDARVLDAPWPIRFAVVQGAVLPLRPRESSLAYQRIWTPEGSPLVVTSRRVAAALGRCVSVPVVLAMRYGNPSIEQGVRELAGRGVSRVFLIPLFPHYAMSSYETAVARVREVSRRLAPGLGVDVCPPYYDHSEYLGALTASAGPYLEGEYDHLLFSFHGIPERHLRKSDPTKAHCLAVKDCCQASSPAHATCYRHQCHRTAEAFTQRAALPSARYSVAFQSRLGRGVWLKPYTDGELVRLARAGVRRLRVICPAFVSDCLETIEEIGVRGRALFLEAGGTEFVRIPCLNEHPEWIRVLAGMVERYLGGGVGGVELRVES